MMEFWKYKNDKLIIPINETYTNFFTIESMNLSLRAAIQLKAIRQVICLPDLKIFAELEQDKTNGVKNVLTIEAEVDHFRCSLLCSGSIDGRKARREGQRDRSSKIHHTNSFRAKKLRNIGFLA